MSEQDEVDRAEYIKRLVDDMPPLRAEQRAAIRLAIHGPIEAPAEPREVA